MAPASDGAVPRVARPQGVRPPLLSEGRAGANLGAKPVRRSHAGPGTLRRGRGATDAWCTRVERNGTEAAARRHPTCPWARPDAIRGAPGAGRAAREAYGAYLPAARAAEPRSAGPPLPDAELAAKRNSVRPLRPLPSAAQRWATTRAAPAGNGSDGAVRNDIDCIRKDFRLPAGAAQTRGGGSAATR